MCMMPDGGGAADPNAITGKAGPVTITAPPGSALYEHAKKNPHLLVDQRNRDIINRGRAPASRLGPQGEGGGSTVYSGRTLLGGAVASQEERNGFGKTLLGQ